MKSKMSKKLIAFILCMVLVICNSVSILADTPAPETATVEKQVKETKTANDKKASDDEAGDTENVSPQSEESAPEVKTTEKKEETTEATTQKKDEADEVTTKAKEETEKAEETTTEAKETTKKEETTETQEEKTTKAKEETSETSGKKDTEKTTEAEEKTAPTELTYDDENVTVTVSAVAEGAIPADATLKVVPILKDDTETKDQYTEVEQKIQEKAAETETEIKGFLAYDITFVDADGNEIEPNSEVKVSMEYKEAALPAEITAEDAKTSEVSVMHLEEDDAGNVSKVVDMGEAGKVDTLETTDAKQVEKVEVKTESFSYYTIYWYVHNSYKGSVEVHYVDTDGNPLDELVNLPNLGTTNENGTDKIINLDNSDKYKVYIPGYTYKRSTVATNPYSAPNSDQIYRVKLSTYEFFGTHYYISYSNSVNGNNWNAFDDSESIYMVYQKDSSGGGSTGGGSSATGNLAHQKYVKDNGDGTYDLTLNVTGAVGTEANPAKVDIVFVLDLSGSMKGDNLDEAKAAVDTLTTSLGNRRDVNSQWKLVTFSSSASSKDSWTSANGINSTVRSFTDRSCSGGTNYEAGLRAAGNVIKSGRTNATKIVIFLTDGQPTYYVNGWGSNESGGGNYTTLDDYNGALEGAETITCDQFYAIGMGLPDDVGEDHSDGVEKSGYTVLQEVANKVSTSKRYVKNVDNNESLSDVFEDIAGDVTEYTASNVTIVDTLTSEVDMVDGNTLTVMVTDGEGTDVTEQEQKAGKIVATYNPQTKQIRLDFDDEYVLKQDYTYSVTMKIQPNEEAKQLYIDNDYEYPHTGEANTGETSAGKPGIFSNVEDSATVTWTTNGEEKEGLYNRPVVQLPKENTPTPPPTTEKELSREKYVKDNKDGTYDLTLNVSGQVGSVTNKAKVDVLLLIDVSTSMRYGLDGTEYDSVKDDSRITEAKKAVKELTDELAAKSDTVDSRWKVVTFGKTATNLTPSWTTANEAYRTVNGINIREDVGTNYEAGFAKTVDALNQDKRADAEQIVIFLTDGAPTYAGENANIGDGSYTSQTILDATNDAAKKIACNQFYAIGIGIENVYVYNGLFGGYKTDGTAILNNIANNVSSTIPGTVKNTTGIVQVFRQIAASITSFLCSNVTITDTLSKYAEIADENAKLEIIVTKNNGVGQQETVVGTSQNGTVEKGAELTLQATDTNELATLRASYNEETKQITLEFPDEYKLEADLTYYVTVEIAPTIDAYEEYDEKGRYPHTGDNETDAEGNYTSSEKPGFFSNDNAKVTYTYNGESGESEYPKPVIQVSAMTTEDAPFISVSKTFSGLSKEQVEELKLKDADENPNNDFTITITSENGTYRDLKLSEGEASDNGLTYTWLLQNYSTGTYSVAENNAELDDYDLNITGTGSIAVSDKDWNFDSEVQAVDINKGTSFTINDQAIVMIALKEEGSYLIWTKNTLSSAQQEAIKSAINGFQQSEDDTLKAFFTSTVNKAYFYSGNTLENGISYGGSKVQCTNHRLSFEHARQWKNVLAGTYELTGDHTHDINIMNAYTPQSINIDFQKYGTDYNTNQMSAKFKLEKLVIGTDEKLTGEIEGSVLEKDVTSATNDFGALAPGVYRLTELEAPAGYVVLPEPIYFKVEARVVSFITVSEDGTIQTAENVQTMYELIPPEGEQDGYIIKIKNDTLYDLPSAGGSGIYWYTVSGALLMMGAALIVYREKRKREVLLRK
ncbi:MAG: VWA domain-containing protein [Clostridiales bacterium]|nr:VWA domain-containing protein [Clostridiales bacterium]